MISPEAVFRADRAIDAVAAANYRMLNAKVPLFGRDTARVSIDRQIGDMASDARKAASLIQRLGAMDAEVGVLLTRAHELESLAGTPYRTKTVQEAGNKVASAAYGARHRLGWYEVQDAKLEYFHELRRVPVDDLTPVQMEDTAELIRQFGTHDKHVEYSALAKSDLEQLRQGTITPDAKELFERVQRFESMSSDERFAYVQTMMAKDPGSITSDEWRDLLLVAHTEDSPAELGILPQIMGRAAWRVSVASLASGDEYYIHDVADYFADFERHHSTEALSAFNAAVERIGAGAPAEGDIERVLDTPLRFRKLMEGRSSDEQHAIADLVMRNAEHVTTDVVWTALQTIRNEALAGESNQLVEDLVQTIDRNVGRIEGTVPSPIRGYPEYSELGEVVAMHEFLDMQRGTI